MLILYAIHAYVVLVTATDCGEDCEWYSDWEPNLAICRTCDISESNLQIKWDTTTQIPFRMLTGSYVTFVSSSGVLSLSVIANKENFDSCSGFSALSTGSSGNVSVSVYLPEPGIFYFASETLCGSGVKVRGVVERKPEKYDWRVIVMILSPSILIFCLSLFIKRMALLFVAGVYFGTLTSLADIGMLLFWKGYVDNFVEYADVDWMLQFMISTGLFISSLLVNFYVGLCFISCTSSSCWIFPCSIITPWFVRLAYSKTFCYGDRVAPRDDEIVMAALVNAAIFYQVAPQLFFQLWFWHERGFLFNYLVYIENISTIGVISMLSGAACLGILLLQYTCPVDAERDDDDWAEEDECCGPPKPRRNSRKRRKSKKRKKTEFVELSAADIAALHSKRSIYQRSLNGGQHNSNGNQRIPSTRNSEAGSRIPSTRNSEERSPNSSQQVQSKSEGTKVDVQNMKNNPYTSPNIRHTITRKESRTKAGYDMTDF